MSQKEIWRFVNENLVAKSIGELVYEQILTPRLLEPRRYVLELKSGVRYEFSAWRSVWEHLRVNSKSIRRCTQDGLSDEVSAGQFFIDAQYELAMDDIVLGNFLEEMHNTLYSDMRIAEKNINLSVSEISTWDYNRTQSILNGHPKILLNKGRLGWGATDLLLYAPENDEAFQFFWVAILKQCLDQTQLKTAEFRNVSLASLSESTLKQFERNLTKKGLCIKDYALVPVHPWQWDRILAIQFAEETAKNHFVPLGRAGDLFLPQISLRTLSNITRPETYDVKVSLSILNTSAVRGIPSKYVTSAPEVADAVSRICETDPFLLTKQTEVLKDVAGLSYIHPLYRQVENAPYRYRETLGVLWRESVASKLKQGELAILAGSLSHQDLEGRSLIGAYIKRSGLSIASWLENYFNVVVVPLYHLQLKYGIGLVAHGQNVVLKLKNFIPCGLFLKDFHGDLRIDDRSNTQRDRFFGEKFAHLEKLPPQYLIHDLITGHFVSVLRFVSEALQESDDFPEGEFYLLLRNCILKYLSTFSSAEQHLDTDILSNRYARVLLNKVRFKIGYGDSAERPLPQLGSDIANPLCLGT